MEDDLKYLMKIENCSSLICGLTKIEARKVIFDIKVKEHLLSDFDFTINTEDNIYLRSAISVYFNIEIQSYQEGRINGFVYKQLVDKKLDQINKEAIEYLNEKKLQNELKQIKN